MKVRFLLFLYFILAALSLKAQVRVGIEVGENFNLSDGSKRIYEYGRNIGFNAKYILQEKTGLGFSLGLNHLSNHPVFVKVGYYDLRKLNIIPIQFSVERILGERKLRPNIGLDLGMFLFQEKILLKGNSSLNHSNIYFGLTPSVGLQFWFSQKMAANINAKFYYVFIESDAFMSINPTIGLSYLIK